MKKLTEIVLSPILFVIGFAVCWIAWFYWQWNGWKLYPEEIKRELP